MAHARSRAPQVDPQLDQTRQKAAREYNGTHSRLHVLGKSRTLQLDLADYWERFEEDRPGAPARARRRRSRPRSPLHLRLSDQA